MASVARNPAARALQRAAPVGQQLLALVVGHPGSKRRCSDHMPGMSSAVQLPAAIPARKAAPSAVVSVFSGTTTGTPSMSAWNCMSQPLAVAPPSARSSSSGMPERGVLSPHGVDRLVGDRLQRGAGQVCASRAAREPDDRSARVRVPVRGAQTGEGGHEVDAVVGVERGGQLLGLGGSLDHAEAVAQPLDRRPGHEHARLERVLHPLAQLPGDRGDQALLEQR